MSNKSKAKPIIKVLSGLPYCWTLWPEGKGINVSGFMLFAEVL
jgi:hypothetical protein